MDPRTKSSLLSQASRVEGWFDEIELSLLVDLVELAAHRCQKAQAEFNIVEVGSYKGRSTIAMGLAVVALGSCGIIYAIDPHQGMRTGRHDQLRPEYETYTDFARNIQKHGLGGIIRCVRLKSSETRITVPVAFMLIDGLHLFHAVSEDFRHFEKNLFPQSLIAFHDYSSDFPGVIRFVDSVLNAENSAYVKFDQTHSLIVIEKK